MTKKMTFSNTQVSSNDETVDFSIGTELKFATILFLSECIIFWFVVYCIRRKNNKVNIEPAVVREKAEKGSVNNSNKVTSP